MGRKTFDLGTKIEFWFGVLIVAVFCCPQETAESNCKSGTLQDKKGSVPSLTPITGTLSPV